jgi:hypothetical protein
MVCQFLNGKVCLPATSEAGARWPRFGLVVDALEFSRITSKFSAVDFEFEDPFTEQIT